VQAQFPEVEDWVLAGHSLGGVAAAEYVAQHPDGVRALVLLASYPASDLSGYAGRTLSLAGTEDQVLDRAAYEKGLAKLPADAQELVIAGGNHAYYGNYGEQAGDGMATISRAEQQRQTVEALVMLAESL
jgi:pimeloyl-ACP methyl ester carboxylesterase